MNKDFKKFQQKYYVEILLKDLLISLSVSFCVAFLFIILDKCEIIHWSIAIYIGVPVTLFVLCFCLLWLILKPKKLKVSKRIDQELQLKQNVETMVSFENQEGKLIELQRQETLSILEQTPKKKFKIRIGLTFIIPFVVSSLMLSCSAFVPSRKDVHPDTPIVITYSDKTLWDIEQIESIKTVITKSSMSDDIKAEFNNSLDLLIQQIKEKNNDDYSSLALNTITESKEILAKYNTNDDVYAKFKASTNSMILSLGKDINSLQLDSIKQDLTDIMNSIEGKNTASLTNYIITSFTELSSIENASEDMLLQSLLSISEALSNLTIDDNIDNTSGIEEAFNGCTSNLRIAILTQRINKNMQEYIDSELRRIFELPEEANPDDDNDPTSSDDGDDIDPDTPNPDTGEDDEDKKDNTDKQGGAGTGETIYGSDEEFYDPEKGQVKYGDVIDEYFANLLALINETEDQEQKEKLIEILNEYYEILYGSEKE